MYPKRDREFLFYVLLFQFYPSNVNYSGEETKTVQGAYFVWRNISINYDNNLCKVANDNHKSEITIHICLHEGYSGSKEILKELFLFIPYDFY